MTHADPLGPRSSRLGRSLAERSERRVRAAVLMASLLGGLSLLLALRTWHERRHLDQEILLGILDGAAVIGLGIALGRGSRIAALLLCLLALGGAAYVLHAGLPLQALVPDAAALLFYGRAIAALRELRTSGGSRHAS